MPFDTAFWIIDVSCGSNAFPASACFNSTAELVFFKTDFTLDIVARFLSLFRFDCLSALIADLCLFAIFSLSSENCFFLP
jgi:hypothetical protein